MTAAAAGVLQGRVVIVTGGSRGIGRYAARSLGRAGAKIALIARDAGRLDEAADEMRRLEAEVLTLSADIRCEEEVRKAMDQVISRFGRVDVLVNSAAVVTHFAMGFPRWPQIRDMDKKFWDQVMDTNVSGTFLCTKHVLPHMEAQRSGHIINLYGGAHVKSLGSCAYVVSKEAILAFTRYVAAEEKEWNICLLAMTPGRAVYTEDAPEEARRRLPGPETMGDSFILAARAGMNLSGNLVIAKEGRLEILDGGGN